MKIPKVIHQTWKTLDVPVELARDFHSWKLYNPDWRFVGWDDALLAKFVMTEFPQYVDFVNSYPQIIDRVNIARYLLLKKYGGVFVDLDMECLKPIEPLLAEYPLLVGREPDTHANHPLATEFKMPTLIGTAFIASVPEHPFWDHVLAALPHFKNHVDPLAATGSIFLTAAVSTYSGKSEIAVAPSTVLYPFDRNQVWTGLASEAASRRQATQDSYAIHQWIGTWRGIRTAPVVRPN